MISTLVVALVLSQAKADAGAAAAPVPAAAPASVALLTISEGLAIPESVLYDAAADVYLVSNINGSPLEKDNNGYISIFTPDGKAGAP
jgi:hypothetical protein